MCLDGIFYHGKAYAISALMVCGWYAIELLEYLLLIFPVDAYAMVRHADDGEMFRVCDGAVVSAWPASSRRVIWV